MITCIAETAHYNEVRLLHAEAPGPKFRTDFDRPFPERMRPAALKEIPVLPGLGRTGLYFYGCVSPTK